MYGQQNIKKKIKKIYEAFHCLCENKHISINQTAFSGHAYVRPMTLKDSRYSIIMPLHILEVFVLCVKWPM